MAQERPNPDELLARVQAEEQQQTRGKLKIFLGYAAGVGKTFAMLEAAHQRRAEGVDLVAGYVETHGRAETEAMLAQLELIPRRQAEYRGTRLTEMDVDAVLARHPQLALVDELAHTNAPGSRHPKRYQDVDELLAAGIDVYTTLNIQHLESLNDVVAQITGIVVRETIPDSVLDDATEIELVDLPPDELLQRLREGKVYVPDQAARALHNFFRTGNLTALREMVMRRAAERVDGQMRAYMQTEAIPGPWAVKERLLVCVSPSPLGERLVRTARRLADELDTEWVAVYVETHASLRLSLEEREQVTRTLQLAEELGGQAVTLQGRSAAETVLNYARKHNVTKIIAGKSIRPRLVEMLRRSVVDHLIRESGPIDVYIISGSQDANMPAERSRWRPHRPAMRYLQSLVLVAVGTLLSASVHPFFSPTNLVMIYLLTVVIAAIYLGRGPSLLAALLSVLAFDFFFVPPRLTLAVADTQYLLTFIALLVVSFVISDLTVRTREQAEAAQQREAQTAELYALSRDLAVATNLDAIMQAIVTHVSQTFSHQMVVLIPDAVRDAVKPGAASPNLNLSENELAVANWAFQHNQPAGRGTDTLPAADMRYLPLNTAHGVVGVLGVKTPEQDVLLPPAQRHLLEAFASQAALAVERAQLAEQAQHARLLQETEKLQTTLLNMISHDLRTPLVSIIGALSGLQEKEVELDAATRNGLLENAREEAERLNRLVGNLLSMTRIEAGALRVMFDPTDIQDVIGVALEQLGDRLPASRVVIQTPDELPLVPMDFVLIAQVLVNLLDNAMKYSTAEAPIEIAAHLAGAFLEIEVRDRGVGIPRQDLKRVFDKFYRVQRPGSVSGTGLGLAICKGIIEAHGGFIAAENRPGGGTTITFALPLQEKTA